MSNMGIEMSLREIARRAHEYREHPDVQELARSLTRAQPDVSDKVARIVEHVRKNSSHQDADDAVLSAATMCLSVGIPCRIVGVRYGDSWTCWFAYEDNGQLFTVDVLDGRRVGDQRKPDEHIVVECQGGVVSKDREYREITEDDVRRSVFKAFGRGWPVVNFIGRITSLDVGKRVYCTSELVVSVESDEQFETRLAEVKVAHGQSPSTNASRLAKLVYELLTKAAPPGIRGPGHAADLLGIDLLRPPNPAHGHAVAVLFADGKDVVIRFEEQGGK